MQLDRTKRRGTSVGLVHCLWISWDERPWLVGWHLGWGRATSRRHRARDMLRSSQWRWVWRHITLAVLIHRTLGRAHSWVWWPHTGALHGSTMNIFYNPLIVHTINGLMHLMHAFLREVCRPHCRHRVRDTWGSRTWPHHTVDRTWGWSGSWTRSENWSRRGSGPWRRPWMGHRTRVCGRGHLLFSSLPVSTMTLEDAEQKEERGSPSL